MRGAPRSLRCTRSAWAWGWLLVALACLPWPDPAVGQALPTRASSVKAAFLYKFPAFVEWPASTFQRPDDALVIGVSGNDAVADDLEQVVAGRLIDGRPVLVRRLRDGEGAAGLHVLLAGGRESRAREAIAATPGPVLVVTDQATGLRLGSVINLVVEDGRVRFAASLPAAEARGLRLSARLLAVAQTVEGQPR